MYFVPSEVGSWRGTSAPRTGVSTRRVPSKTDAPSPTRQLGGFVRAFEQVLGALSSRPLRFVLDQSKCRCLSPSIRPSTDLRRYVPADDVEDGAASLISVEERKRTLLIVSVSSSYRYLPCLTLYHCCGLCLFVARPDKRNTQVPFRFSRYLYEYLDLRSTAPSESIPYLTLSSFATPLRAALVRSQICANGLAWLR